MTAAELADQFGRQLAGPVFGPIVGALVLALAGALWAWLKQRQIVKTLIQGVEDGETKLDTQLVAILGEEKVKELGDETKKMMLKATKNAIEAVATERGLNPSLDKMIESTLDAAEASPTSSATPPVAKAFLFVALSLGALAVGGCRGWPEANADVKQFRAVLTVYRGATTAKNVTETAKVDELGARLDSIAGHMEELTR